MSLRKLEPIYSRLPEVAQPKRVPSFQERLRWTFLVLALFFVLGSIRPLGMTGDPQRLLEFERLQMVLAANIGTLLTIGISPIVMASIFLQLLVGSEIIRVDLTDPKEREAFMGTQKLLAIVLAFVEAAAYSFPGYLPSDSFEGAVLIWIQVALASIILIYLDEVVQKYGIGSGISLFILGGVASQVISRGLYDTISLVYNFPSPVIFRPLLDFIMTAVVILVVVYFDSMYVNIPLSWARSRSGGRFPVKLLYVSNIPIILAVALFANIQLWSFLLKDTPVAPILGVYKKVEQVVGGRVVEKWEAVGGLAYYLNPPYGLLRDMIAGIVAAQEVPKLLEKMLVYSILLTVFSVVFGKLWVDLAGQGPEALAKQLAESGFQIPGFRRDERVIRSVLEKYIPPIVVLGSIFVALLTVLVDFLGGLAGGMSLLLAVTIMSNLYQQMEREKMLEGVGWLEKLLK